MVVAGGDISPTSFLPPQSAKAEAEPQEDAQEQLPILADMILYYCRFATRPVLLQLYHTEVGRGKQGWPCLCHRPRGCGTATTCC